MVLRFLSKCPKKLWQKDFEVNKEIEKYTVGNDFILDKELVEFDVYGSIAHASMLNKIKIIADDELNQLKKSLLEILELNKENKFKINQEDEDCHTAIENHLTNKLGDLGKKIHTARSRNDQVLVCTRLYSKKNILEIQKLTLEFIKLLAKLAAENKNTPMPGYTHTRKAMPSSVGLYFSAFAESLIDDLELLEESYEINDQCPLGSAAGYGVPLDIDRQFTSNLLGFEKVQNNTLYVQNSRGKIEANIVFALSNIMQNLSKLSTDMILFGEFGFFKLPDQFTTGSSIMPQKKNPDVFELTRAKASKVDSNLFLIKDICKNLISGYHRDFQLTKEPLIDSVEVTLSALRIFNLVFGEIEVNEKNCIDACTKELFATDKVYEMVKKGSTFRDAYKKVGTELDKVEEIDPKKAIKIKTHLGATGNLGIDKINEKVKDLEKEIDEEIEKFEDKMNKLLK